MRKRTLKFFVQQDNVVSPADLEFARVLCAGYAGRDQEAVRRHIEELAELGVPAPDRVPVIYPVTLSTLVTGHECVVQTTGTSGEVEFALLLTPEGWLVTVGSDHTDRELEKVDVLRSKQVAPKLLSPLLWRWEDVADHWDSLVLRAWTGSTPEEVELYQEAPVSSLLSPSDLVGEISDYLGQEPRQTVIFSGTVPLIGGFREAPLFQMELEDPVLGRRIRHHYTIYRLDAKKGGRQ